MEKPHAKKAHQANPSGPHQSWTQPQQPGYSNAAPAHMAGYHQQSIPPEFAHYASADNGAGPMPHPYHQLPQHAYQVAAHHLPYSMAAPPPPDWQHPYAQQVMAGGIPPYPTQPPIPPEMFAQQANGHQGQPKQQASGANGNEGLKAMLNDIGHATGLGKLSEILSLDDREFWKGAIVGASIAMLASNKNLHALMGMANNLMASMNAGEPTEGQESSEAQDTSAPEPTQENKS